MMRLCNANFATDGPCVTIKRADTKHTIGGDVTMGTVEPEGDLWPNALWWHSLMEKGIYGNKNYPWPVCWRKDGVMALWFGKDGWVAWPGDTCRKHGKNGFIWAFDAMAPTGGTFAYYGTGGDSEDIPLSGAEGGAYKETYIKVNGAYVLYWPTHDPEKEIHEAEWDYHNPYHEEDTRRPGKWCGHNVTSREPFVMFSGTGQYPPDPTQVSQYYYKISCRCSRLLLAQNAMLKPDNTIDFSKARVRYLGHAPKGTYLAGVNRKNGERPLFYERGAGRGRGIEVDDDFHFPPLDNAADPRTDDTDPESYNSPVFAPLTTRDGIGRPYQGDNVDWPRCWPALIRRDFSAFYWNATPNGNSEDVVHVKTALENDPGLVEELFWKEVPYCDDPVRPVAYETAFDMVVAVRTYYWRKFIAEIKDYTKTDKNGEEWPLVKGSWKSSTSGYFNSKIAGWIYQLAPTKGV